MTNLNLFKKKKKAASMQVKFMMKQETGRQRRRSPAVNIYVIVVSLSPCIAVEC